MTLPVALLVGLGAGLVLAWIDAFVARRRAGRARSRLPAAAEEREQQEQQEDRHAPPQSEREVAAAWLQFLRQEVADTVAGINNRLTVIKTLAHTILRGDGSLKVQDGLEQMLVEVDRAAAATAALQQHVSSTASAPVIPAVADAPARPSRPGAILIVDSDDGVREVLGQLFQSLGHRVVPAHDGVEGFEILQSERVDCVVTATHLSRLSGVGFYTQVEQRLPFASRRFVFICGESQRPDIREFLESTGCPIIPKPLNVAVLVEAVNQVIAKVEHDPANRRPNEAVPAAVGEETAERR
jgi:CheY-like chemotaxis protein